MAEKRPIFISYADPDEVWVRQVKEELARYSVDAWLDEDVGTPGEEWPEQFRNALDRMRHVLFIITPAADRSHRVALELGAVLALRKDIIPIVAPEISRERVPGPLRLRKWIEKRDPGAVAAEVARRMAA